MSPLSFLRSIYSLDTLDTRFTTSSTTSYKTVIDSRGEHGVKDAQKEKIASRASPPKWKTPEFFFYYLVFAICIPLMLWIPYSVSRPSDPRYEKYQVLLVDGWVPGRKIDNSDSQYRSFRKNIPYMALLLVFHPLCRKIWNRLKPLPAHGRTSIAEQGEARLEQRASFDYLFAMIFLAALHGFSIFKVLAILFINYNLATRLPRKSVPYATWAFNIGTLFANELCQGYHYKDIAALLSGYSPMMIRTAPMQSGLIAWGAWLDTFGGIMSRWEVLFNITVLRLISFNLDYYWSVDHRGGNPIEKKQLDPTALSERDRVTVPAPAKDFTFRNYVAYALYAPLYLTGPILTFNDYISQLRYRPHSIETPRTIRYAVRFLLCLLCMELLLHFIYVGAIAKAYPDWSSYTPAQLSLLSYHNLMIIWLKLLLPWRLFRLWSLIDGIDPPENMVRCVSDNFSTISFWRGWHRSYNKWLIRYIWIPLGGASFTTVASSIRSTLSYLLIFTFVALWHDIQLRLLIWAWLIVLFIVPEAVARIAFPKKNFEGRERRYRMICCVGAVANVLMLMAANLVGFAFGLDGLQSILRGIFQELSGMLFFITACSALFVGVQVMFEVRESEARKGISLKC
ncbi:Glycerol uptake protein 1 [Cytospora mali]|uniref:Glycerol uptake protein 1 n=1 Tax=Cytospora mali TaxID=578113 RepID=A0A194UZK6_CYTMA|nr:Glycerol uptake protein 1 [Valsa mali var. pyri (nom. inval.)]